MVDVGDLPRGVSASRCDGSSLLHLRLASYTVRIASTSTECLDRIRYLCEGFLIEPIQEVDDELRLCPNGDAARAWTAWCRGMPILSGDTPARLAGRLEWWLCNEAVQRSSDLLHIHAGAVARNGAAVLFPAVSGAGKSTLSMALLARGFQLLADDLVFIQPELGEVQPFWRSFHLDVRSVLLLRRLGVHCRAASIRQYTFPPSAFGLEVPPQLTPLRYIVLPDREGLPPGELVPLEQAEAAVALRPLSAALRVDDPPALTVLQRLLARCACFRLGTGDLAVAIDAIDALVGST